VEWETNLHMIHDICFPDALNTSRLSLRRYGAADSEALLKLVKANRAHLIESFPEMAQRLSTPAEAALFLDDKATQWSAGKTYCYGIWRADSESMAGQIQAKNIVWNIPRPNWRTLSPPIRYGSA